MHRSHRPLIFSEKVKYCLIFSLVVTYGRLSASRHCSSIIYSKTPGDILVDILVDILIIRMQEYKEKTVK